MTSVIQGNLRQEVYRMPPLLVDPVMRWFDRLHHECGQESLRRLTEHGSSMLVRLVACSEFAGSAIIRDWTWFAAELESGRILQVPGRESLTASLRDMLGLVPDPSSVKRALREFRNRQMLAIFWRDLSDACDLAQTIASLSDLADVLIECTSNHVRAGLV
ncbi:MAG: hypothetical protein L0Y45_02800, partial [Woeseiaceae bacterium]|nr:hypothetical protein [Woeseiaceae bacterium]